MTKGGDYPLDKIAIDPEECISVGEMASLVCSPDERKKYLAMIRGYCDESYDGAQRVYALAAFLARDKEWERLSRQWRNRCLRNSVPCYHAADCEDRRGDFAHLSKEQQIGLNSDLITLIQQHKIVGFCTGIYLEDYNRVLAAHSNPRLATILGPSPYFLVMQFLVADVCSEILRAERKYRVAFIFDQQEEFSGRAKQLYDGIREKNPSYAPHMGSLTYADKRRFIPLQTVDKLAYEGMKCLLNRRYDRARPERRAMARLKEHNIQAIRYLDYEALENLVATLPNEAWE